jgi:hypothetical protein
VTHSRSLKPSVACSIRRKACRDTRLRAAHAGQRIAADVATVSRTPIVDADAWAVIRAGNEVAT